MDLQFTPDEEAFREEVHAFLKEKLLPALAELIEEAIAAGIERACSAAISAVKYTIGHVGTLIAKEAIKMHGGIGMTWELPVSHFAKRLTMIGHQFGDEDCHLGRYAAPERGA